MIDVMKRLAELDSTNPNIIKENTSVEECGPMGMMGMGGAPEPKTPATLNVTASSGEELGDMLAAIMKLAGLQKVEPEHLGAEHEPAMMTAEPISVVGPHAPEPSAGDDMRDMMSVVDKMNPEQDSDEEETDEGKDEFGIDGVNNTPNRPDAHKSFDGNEFAYQPNDGSTHGRGQKNNPHGNPQGHETEKEQGAHMTMEEQLMSEYKNFINEAKECKVCHEPMKKCKCD